jgi:SAM-dependent methyltransferase
MTNDARTGAFTVEDVDFDAFYQGRPALKGVGITFDVVPWDIGEPQPALIALERSGTLRSPLLDAGCGLGENAIFLAGRGYRVTGFDASETALARARQRARDRGVDVEFVQADATRLEALDQRFTTVIDSALYHCLGDVERSAYAEALRRVTVPGAALHIFCFADASEGFRLPAMQVTEGDLRTHLAAGWDIRSIAPTTYTSAMTVETLEKNRDGLAALGGDLDLNAVRTDERGRILMPVWHLQAVRMA